MDDCIVIASLYANPLHEGHLDYLEASAKLGKLWVIVNNDYQRKLKGSREFLPEGARLRIIRSLKCVFDASISVDDDLSVCCSIREVYWRFDGLYPVRYFCNGGDVQQNCREEEVCKDLGITCLYGVGGSTKVDSSSKILEKCMVK